MYKFYKSELCKRMSDTLILDGKSESTQLTYLRQARLLTDFYHKSPDLISEDEMRRFLVHRKTIDGLSVSGMRITHAGLRFFTKQYYTAIGKHSC